MSQLKIYNVALDFLCTEKIHKLKSESLWIWTLNEIAQKQIKVDHKKKFTFSCSVFLQQQTARLGVVISTALHEVMASSN